MTRVARMLCGLFALFLLGAAVPFASAQEGHSPTQATPASPGAVEWRVEDVTPVEVDGIPVTMSPDGAWIAGIGPELSLCLWNVATMEPTCDQGEPIPILTESLVWSPDSTAVAFTEDAFMRAYESDIHVFEVGSSESVNITDDGDEGVLFSSPPEGPRPGDVAPVWTLDSQSLIFARSDFSHEDPTTDLMRIARAGGEPESLGTVSITPYAIYMPMHVLSDGSLLFTHASLNLDDPDNGIWVRSPEGDLRQVLPGGVDADYPLPVISNVYEDDGAVRIAAHSFANLAQRDAGLPVAFILELESGEITPLESNDGHRLVGQTAFSPDGATTWVATVGGGSRSLIQMANGEQQVIELVDNTTSAGSFQNRFSSLEWRGENTLFVPSGNSRAAYILTMTSDAGDTPATPVA